MTPKSKRIAAVAATMVAAKVKVASEQNLPVTLEDHVFRIEALAKRIDGYIRFMCQVVAQPGISMEVKTRAALAFHDQLSVAEKRLARVHDEFRLE